MRVAGRLPYAWGATPGDLAAAFACDRHVADPEEALVRAVTIEAAAATTFRWLCQLRIAPYSYDWIDNWGRTSPRRLTPGLERLEIGQPFMSIFELVDFEHGRHVTLKMAHPAAVARFGQVSGTYAVEPIGPARSRLVVKLLVRYPRRPPWAWMRHVLPWGDLVMMRKQLLTLKSLAEGSR